MGSTTRQGQVPWYSEACASTFTTTFSSGVATDPQIVSTQLSPQHRPRPRIDLTRPRPQASTWQMAHLT